MKETGLVGEREVGGYLFKLFDEDEWGFGKCIALRGEDSALAESVCKSV